jgi:S1-C subfamily serine protease
VAVFADAVDHASKYTFPYVGLRRRADGSVYSILASFIVLNDAGWAVASAHTVEEILSTKRMIESVRSSDHIAPDAVTHALELWALPGGGGHEMSSGRVNHAADIAVFRFERFDSSSIDAFPVLRDTKAEPIRPGESLCRIGFPFHGIEATFDAEASQFRLAAGAFPVPRFALDGIVSRFSQRGVSGGGSGHFIEISTPGLRGQSGGPVVDTSGRVCGVQSQTAHLDLGFDARYEDLERGPITERQFLNVGLATHVEEVASLLDAEGAAYSVG